ncbi:hypothetical protein [Pyrolobus fumarii]|nr:hypothetical protein [Pyrolobus fumarii]
MGYKKRDEQGRIVESSSMVILAWLSKDRKTLTLVWEPRVPFTENMDVRVKLYDENNELVAQGIGKILPGDRSDDIPTMERLQRDTCKTSH